MNSLRENQCREKNENICSFEEAGRMLEGLSVSPKTEKVLLQEAYNRVLAEDVTAKIPVPHFRKSAYDGFALKSEDVKEAEKERPAVLKIRETIGAGSLGAGPLRSGTAVKIMTGAMVPEGADTVVMHEDTCFSEETVEIFHPAAPGNIIEAGEDVSGGSPLLLAGTVLEPADLALLAGQGFAEVMVYRRPKAALLSTGSELIEPGKRLEAGKIYNTNAVLLGGYLKKYGLIPEDRGIVKDSLPILKEQLEAALSVSDLVVTTGGVSAGDYDYVQRALEEIGAEILFHRLPFKPGGAMLAAVKDGKVILGLSGNPGAAAVGLLAVGLPYLKKLCGRRVTQTETAEAVLAQPFGKASRGTRFLRGKAGYEHGKLVFESSENQRNGSVSSLQELGLLGEISAGTPPLPAGEKIKVFFV